MSDQRGEPRRLTMDLSTRELAVVRGKLREAERCQRFVLLLFDRGGLKAVPLVEGRPVIVGRELPADVRVNDASLSRQHAQLELVGQEVWVEDLQSTNGTWLGGQRVQRARVPIGADLSLGALSAAVQRLEPGDSQNLGTVPHEQFGAVLAAELERARQHQRHLVVCMLRGGSADAAGRWLPALRKALRPYDALALYSHDTAELCLVEGGFEVARRLLEPLLREHPTLRCGAAAYPSCATSAEALLSAARAALLDSEGGQRLVEAVAAGRAVAAKQEATEFVSRSAAMSALLDTVRKLGGSVIPVLIHGETGSGKEVVSRALHDLGPRRGKPFVAINCGAIPDQLVESQLFGHERGAFTSASQMSQGVFEAAQGGTVLLDEVGELPAPAQAALLRALETKRICRVGSTREIEVDVRVIAATHRDLEAMCREGGFREDLLYRLNAVTLDVPPLRERPEDIEPLVRHFMEQANRSNGCQVRAIDAEALELCRCYRWPGNVRELRNAVERAVVLAQDDRISADSLPERVREARPLEARPEPTLAFPSTTTSPEGHAAPEVNLRAELDRLEIQLIRQALERCDWDRARAARSLGLPLRTLANKIQAHAIQR